MTDEQFMILMETLNKMDSTGLAMIEWIWYLFAAQMMTMGFMMIMIFLLAKGDTNA